MHFGRAWSRPKWIQPIRQGRWWAMVLASRDDLALLLGVPSSDPRLELALRRASGRFADAVGWPVIQVVGAEVWVHGQGGREIFLPALNVTDATVTIDGAPVTDALLDGRLGCLSRIAGWPRGSRSIKVVYTSGWPTGMIPDGIQDAVLEQAAVVASTLGIISQESALSLSVSYSPTATVGVTQKWADAVEAYKVGSRS